MRERFGNGVSKLTLTRHNAMFSYPFPPKEVVGYFRQYFGPTQMTFARLDENGRAELTAQMEAMWEKHNLSPNGETKVQAEYLDVRATRA